MEKILRFGLILVMLALLPQSWAGEIANVSSSPQAPSTSTTFIRPGLRDILPCAESIDGSDFDGKANKLITWQARGQDFSKYPSVAVSAYVAGAESWFLTITPNKIFKTRAHPVAEANATLNRTVLTHG